LIVAAALCGATSGLPARPGVVPAFCPEPIHPLGLDSELPLPGVCDAQVRLDALDRALRRRSNHYLVIDNFGHPGGVCRETEVERTDLETIITDLMSGQFNDPARVVAFNTSSTGRKTSRRLSPAKFRPVAISKAAAYPTTSRISSSATGITVAG